MARNRLALLIASAAAVAACGATETQARRPAVDCNCELSLPPLAKDVATSGAAAAPAAPSHSDANRPPAPLAPRFSGRRIDLEVKDADLHNLFRLLAEVGGVNIVVGDEVQGRISLRLRHLPWDQVLDVVVRARGLEVTRSGTILLIGKAKSP